MERSTFYKKYYALLMSAVEDALIALDERRSNDARVILSHVQQVANCHWYETFVERGSPKDIPLEDLARPVPGSDA